MPESRHAEHPEGGTASDARDPVVASLLTLTTRLGERLVTARREVEAIDALLDRLCRAPAAPSPSQTGPLDSATRTRAIALALEGHDRAQAEARLAAELEPAALAAVLDDVFGPPA